MSFSARLMYNVVKYDVNEKYFVKILGTTDTKEKAIDIVVENIKNKDIIQNLISFDHYNDGQFDYKIEKFFNYTF